MFSFIQSRSIIKLPGGADDMEIEKQTFDAQEQERRIQRYEELMEEEERNNRRDSE